MLVLDESGVEKTGDATAGVKRRYVGCAGRVTNAVNLVNATNNTGLRGFGPGLAPTGHTAAALSRVICWAGSYAMSRRQYPAANGRFGVEVLSDLTDAHDRALLAVDRPR